MALTRELAAYIVTSRPADIPAAVQHQGVRAFLNYVGCVLGGCRDPAVEIALKTLLEFAGPPQASLIGRRERLDVLSATLINCSASSIHVFDDTHLKSVTHPTGPVAAALLALAERAPIAGRDFVHALVLGIELECRMANVLTVPPASTHLGFFMTSLVGPLGAAVASAKVLGLNETQTANALSFAAAHAGGFRETHGTMAGGYLAGHAARAGLLSALMAQRGFTASETGLEGKNGFAAVFAQPNLAAATDGLGQTFELAELAYKPYPCGIVIHQVIDACLDLAREHDIRPDDIIAAEFEVPPLSLDLTGRSSPATGADAKISLYHWAAAALLVRRAGLAEVTDAFVNDPAVIAIRGRIKATRNERYGRDEASAVIRLKDGRELKTHVAHARGSVDRPMSDDDLTEKFIAQAELALPTPRAKALADACWAVGAAKDITSVLPLTVPQA